MSSNSSSPPAPAAKRNKTDHHHELAFASRPEPEPEGFGTKFGRRGDYIKLRANFFRVKIDDPDLPIFHHDVEIIRTDRPPRAGSGIPRRLALLLWDNFAVSHPEQGSTLASTVFDGAKNAYGPFHFKKSARSVDGINFEVELVEPGVTLRAGVSPPRYNLRITTVAGVSLQALLRYTASAGAHDLAARAAGPEALVALQALQTLIGHDLRSAFPLTGGQGRKFYDISSGQNITLGGQVLRGIFQSMRATIRSVSVNLDTAYSAFVTPGRMDRVVYEIIGRGQAIGSPIGPADWVSIGKVLKGARVRLSYRGNPTYKLLGFSNDTASSTIMELQDRSSGPSHPQNVPPPPPQTMSIEQFFAVTYNLHVGNRHLRLAILPGKQQIPLDFLELLPGHPIPFMRIHPTQTQNMIAIASKAPQVRKTEIEENRQRAGYDHSARLVAWGVKVAPKMTNVLGRVLDPPAVTYHPTSPTPSPPVSRGAWNLTRSMFLRPSPALRSWAVLNLSSKPILAVETFVLAFVSVCLGKGMEIPNRQPPISTFARGSLLQSLRTACQNAWNNGGQRDPQLVLVIVPDRNTYEQLKAHAAFDLKIPLITQFVMADKVMQNGNRLDQYLANVALKVNLKLGGENWTVNDRFLPKVTGRTMLLGADVSHGGPGSFEPSVAAVVASTGPSHATYRAEIRSQDPRVELIHDMAEMVERHLVRLDGALPDKIIFFRDGVSEGELDRVLEVEVDAVKEACRKISEQRGVKYDPPLTFLVCGKRHRVRFFGAEPKDLDNKGNLPPGTIVTQEIVDPFKWDFYLQSHAGLIGTARPLHLIVLFDENGFSADDLQQMCHSLAFSFARATRSVSLTPPAYYADLACGKARVLIARDMDNNPLIDGAEYPPLRFQQEVIERRIDPANPYSAVHPYPDMWFM